MLNIDELDLAEIYQLAESENTPSDILVELSKEKNRDILQRVASNPNASRETLSKLCLRFPDEVVNNPICNLLYLEDPNGMQFLKFAEARSKHTSTERLLELLRNGDISIINTLLERKKIPLEVLQEIVNTKMNIIANTISFSSL